MDTFRTTRRARQPWTAILAHLEKDHELQIARQGLSGFSKQQQKGRIPFGFPESEDARTETGGARKKGTPQRQTPKITEAVQGGKFFDPPTNPGMAEAPKWKTDS